MKRHDNRSSNEKSADPQMPLFPVSVVLTDTVAKKAEDAIS